MKSFSRVLATAVIALTAAAVSQSLHAYAYNPWTTSTGEKVLAINPFVYAPTLNPMGLGADLVAAYGITSSLDVMVDFAGLSFMPSFSYNYSWGMVRYDLGANNIIALQASQTWISPQYHFFWENDIFAAEANLYANFLYSSFSTPTIGAYIAPVVKIVKDVFYAYVEVDPSFTVGGSFALNLVPGIWLGLGSYGQISLGVGINGVTSGTITPGVYAWYFLPIDFKAKK